jgi:hypothetical protein
MSTCETKEYHLNKLYNLSVRSIRGKTILEKPILEKSEYLEGREWSEKRIQDPAWSWERWDDTKEEWMPFNRFGEFVNQWRLLKS